MNLSWTSMLGVTFQNLCGKQKGHKSMSVASPTIIYFEIYMYLRAQRGVSLQRNEPSNRLVLPDVKGQREYFEGGEDDTR